MCSEAERGDSGREREREGRERERERERSAGVRVDDHERLA